MLKSQFVIVFVSAILLILIFRLPKVIVSSDEIKTEEPYAASVETKTEGHKVFLSETESQKVSYLTEQLKTVSDKKKMLIFADSLAQIFAKHLMFDSAAFYLETASKLESSKENLQKAAEAYYDAFTLGSDPAKAKAYNDKARKLYEMALEIGPEDNNLKAKYALTFMSSDNPMKGIGILREILEKDPANEPALFNLGLLSIQSGQYDKAVDRFKQILNNNPVHPNAHFYLGMCYANLGNKQQALHHLEKAKEVNKDPAIVATVDKYIKEIH